MDLGKLTIETAHELLTRGEISAEELARTSLGRIKGEDGILHAFLSVDESGALEAARDVDKRIAAKEAVGLLAGAPGAVKDNILIKGVRATAASKILENYHAPYDASAVAALKKNDAVIVGKTNLDEFAMGSSTENSAFGVTKNPHDVERVPGGSSGGSAAAVASGECIWAIGTDTGGSIRQPASFCGVVGLKPTYGAVSRYGLIAMASSLDQAGPIAKTVTDAAIVFEVMAGYDPMDATSAPQADYKGLAEQVKSEKFKIQNLKIGVPKEYFGKGLDAQIEASVRSAVTKAEELGAKVEEISLPHTPYALACYYIIQPAEVSANLSRYDGMRYGASKMREVGAGIDLKKMYSVTRGEGFGKEVRRRIMLGTYVLSAGYYDAYYAKAQKVRRLVRDDFIKAFEKVDVIFTPTSPTLPFRIGERTKDPLAMYLADVYTVSVNLAGLPGFSLPCGWAEEGGKKLPIGLQIIGKPFDERTILRVGRSLELAEISK